jgi:hypothetical protein
MTSLLKISDRSLLLFASQGEKFRRLSEGQDCDR